jgi:hypothetical protein
VFVAKKKKKDKRTASKLTEAISLDWIISVFGKSATAC